MLKRDQLGETFGTRKAKSRIKAVERNKVDAEAQAGVKDHLLSSIEVAAQNIPTAGECGLAISKEVTMLKMGHAEQTRSNSLPTLSDDTPLPTWRRPTLNKSTLWTSSSRQRSMPVSTRIRLSRLRTIGRGCRCCHSLAVDGSSKS